MDLNKASQRAAARLRQDDTENLCRLAARLTQMQEEAGIPGAPESALTYALRTRRRLRRPLSTTR
jgi:hypothetical protein